MLAKESSLSALTDRQSLLVLKIALVVKNEFAYLVYDENEYWITLRRRRAHFFSQNSGNPEPAY